jgi:hypothetical protein
MDDDAGHLGTQVLALDVYDGVPAPTPFWLLSAADAIRMGTRCGVGGGN